jgi:DnaK suppressor protein
MRQALLERRNELLAMRRNNLAEAEELFEADETDTADAAADVASARVFERLGDTELRELERIGEALDRLDRGTYGRCIVCGHRIASARLFALPEADRCITCSR